MTTVLAVLVLIAGFGLAVWSSAQAVGHLRILSARTSIPPFFLGVTLVALGTDLPEIANSIVSSYTGHGDLNAGDSVGSVLTQATLVLGLLPLLAGPFEIRRMRVFVVATATMVALGLGIFVMRDSYLSRMDGGVLILSWLVGSLIIVRHLTPASEQVEIVEEHSGFYHTALSLVFLALIGVGATAAVRALVTLSTLLSVPEYVLAFVVGALGTSLPELVFDVTAIRSGLNDMAIGDVLGSSWVDATVSLGIGPLLFPVVVSGAEAVRGSLIALVAIGLVALILPLSKRHTRVKGVALILVYLLAYAALLTGGGAPSLS